MKKFLVNIVFKFCVYKKYIIVFVHIPKPRPKFYELNYNEKSLIHVYI